MVPPLLAPLAAAIALAAPPAPCTASTGSLRLSARAPAQAPEEAPVRDPLFERVAVIGASLSDGFGLRKEFGAAVDLGGLLSAAVPESGEVRALGSSLLFLDAVARSDAMLAEAHAFEPTLVVAVDFLFWFSYGTFTFEASRLALFEEGLERLDRFECPVLVGTVPDMRGALEGTSIFGPMLAPRQIPEPETLQAVNERLRAWASERERVHVVPLAEFTRRLLAEEPVALRDQEWAAAPGAPLLQPDLLHPTVRGARAVALLTLDALARAYPRVEGSIEWRDTNLAERLREVYAKELREEERERQEREERRARRLQKRDDADGL